MDVDFGRAATVQTETGRSHAVPFKIGKAVLGAAAIAGLMAFLAQPASAEDKAAAQAASQSTELTGLPSLGRHVRRAARLPFNVSLKADDKKDAANAPARRPSLARFVRARGHGSEATTVDGYGPDRLVQSLTFPAGAPPETPKGTAMADAKEDLKIPPGL